jgi:uncharacterized phage-associated protein
VNFVVPFRWILSDTCEVVMRSEDLAKGLGRMSVKFKLDIEKVVAVILYLSAKNIPDLTPGKLFKLMFLAEKYHLVRYGRTITGDRYDAMKDGPVPSWTYDLFKKDVLKHPFSDVAMRLVSSLCIDKSFELPHLSAKTEFDREQLSESDIAALDRTVARFGQKTFFELRAETHGTVAYEKAWSARGSKMSHPMDFEQFFEGDEDALVGTKEEMLENHVLKTVLAKP